MKYVRTLTSSEASAHFVLIGYLYRDEFPPMDKKFKVKHSNREYEARIDYKNRMWLGRTNTLDWKRGFVFQLEKHSTELFSIHQVMMP